MPLTKPAPDDAIENAKKAFLPRRLPAALLRFWTASNGFEGENMLFFSTDEILERNETLEVRTYCPEYVAVATDNGSQVAFLRAESEADEIYINYAADMQSAHMKTLSMSLETWISKDCPFSLEPAPEYSAIENVEVQLDALPACGKKDLLEIRKALNLSMPIQELWNIESKLPLVLCDMSYIRALRFAEPFNKDTACISIWRKAEPRIAMPLLNPFDTV